MINQMSRIVGSEILQYLCQTWIHHKPRFKLSGTTGSPTWCRIILVSCKPPRADVLLIGIVDGLRIDTVKHVQKSFWPGFNDAAGVYSVGEIFDGDPAYTCDYQNYLDGVLNYPMYVPTHGFVALHNS